MLLGKGGRLLTRAMFNTHARHDRDGFFHVPRLVLGTHVGLYKNSVIGVKYVTQFLTFRTLTI